MDQPFEAATTILPRLTEEETEAKRPRRFPDSAWQGQDVNPGLQWHLASLAGEEPQLQLSHCPLQTSIITSELRMLICPTAESPQNQEPTEEGQRT